MLTYKDKTEGCKILHGRNGREYRLPELPHLSKNEFYPEYKNVVYEFFGCYWHVHTCLQFRDVTTFVENTLDERYEHIMFRMEQIKRAGCQVEKTWGYQFNVANLSHHPKLNTCCSTAQSSKHSR
jgi:G:T-mismatch repair DNA endonuclease (very short patch repair protein)